MPSETDLIKLYSDKILKMAADPIYRDRLPTPDASATKRSPLCGSAVTVDINVEGGTGLSQVMGKTYARAHLDRLLQR